MLYKDAVRGMRKHLVRHHFDGEYEAAFVSEAYGRRVGELRLVDETNDNFEHLTCFVGGMLVLGEWRRRVCVVFVCCVWVGVFARLARALLPCCARSSRTPPPPPPRPPHHTHTQKTKRTLQTKQASFTA